MHSLVAVAHYPYRNVHPERILSEDWRENYGTCNHFAMTDTAHTIRCKDSSQPMEVNEAIYLGGVLRVTLVATSSLIAGSEMP